MFETRIFFIKYGICFSYILPLKEFGLAHPMKKMNWSGLKGYTGMYLYAVLLGVQRQTTDTPKYR